MDESGDKPFFRIPNIFIIHSFGYNVKMIIDYYKLDSHPKLGMRNERIFLPLIFLASFNFF